MPSGNEFTLIPLENSVTAPAGGNPRTATLPVAGGTPLLGANAIVVPAPVAASAILTGFPLAST